MLPESYLDMFDSTGPGEYWSARFPMRICKQFRLGFDPVTKASVYPVRDGVGNLIGVVTRGDKPKYKYPAGFTGMKNLFNIHEAPSSFVLVEGAPDVMSLAASNIPAVGVYGSRLYSGQVDLIKALEPLTVLVAFDQDMAGQAGAKDAVAILRHSGIFAKNVTWNPEYNDPDELPDSYRQELFGSVLSA